MAIVKVNSILKLIILSLLWDQPYCGYELLQSVKRLSRKNASTGTVYPFLHELKNNNYLIYDKDTVTSKSKKIYSLTTEGKIFAKRSLEILKMISDKFIDNCEVCGNGFININEELKSEVVCDKCKSIGIKNE